MAGAGGVDAALEDAAAHAGERGVAGLVAERIAVGLEGAEMFFGLDELVGEAVRLEVREVVSVAQAKADGLAAGELLEEARGLPGEAC